MLARHLKRLEQPVRYAARIIPGHLLALGKALRKAVMRTCGGPGDACNAAAVATKMLHPAAQIYLAYINQMAHAVPKLEGHFIDTTADQFGEEFPPVSVFHEDDLDTPNYRHYRHMAPDVYDTHPVEALADSFPNTRGILAALKAQLGVK